METYGRTFLLDVIDLPVVGRNSDGFRLCRLPAGTLLVLHPAQEPRALRITYI